MIKNKNKWITIGIVFLLFLLYTGFGVHYNGQKIAKPSVKDLSDLDGKVLSGISTRLPEASLKLMCEGMLGVSLKDYKGFRNVDEILDSVRTGGSAAAFFPDVTAEYIASQYKEFTVLRKEKKDTPRFSFGIAFKNNDRGEELKEVFNEALSAAEEDGTLAKLRKKYISKDAYDDIKFFSQHESRGYEPGTFRNYSVPEGILFSKDDMKHKDVKGQETLTVSITGCVPPVELLDENGTPCGFCAALCDELAKRTGFNIDIVVAENETILSELMSGRTDAVFAYGAGRVTVESRRNYTVTDGYLDIYDYAYVALGEETADR